MDDLQDIKRQIAAMPPHEQLHFAGSLLEQAITEPDPRKKLSITRTAQVLAARVSTELGAALALHELKGG